MSVFTEPTSSSSTVTERVRAVLALDYVAVSVAQRHPIVDTHAARVDFGRRAGGDAEATEACVLVSSPVSVMSPRLRLSESS